MGTRWLTRGAAVVAVSCLAAPSAAAPAASSARALLDQYCVRCHNDRLQTAGVALDAADVEQVARDAALWERAVRKLRARAMPPAGSPRPAEAAYDDLVGYLEGELDRLALAAPRSRPHRYLPAPQPHGVSERDPRSAGAGRRRDGAAAARRRELRLRQRRRREPLAGAARALSVGGGQGQPAGRRQRRARAGEPRGRAARGSHAGRPLRRPAVRHARRHGRHPQLSGGRRVRDPGAPVAQPERERRGSVRPPRSRDHPGRRAAAGVRDPAEPDGGGRLLRRRGHRQAPAGAGDRRRGPAPGRGRVPEEELRADRDRAAAVRRPLQHGPAPPHAARRALGGHRGSVRHGGGGRYAQPPAHLRLPPRARGRRAGVRPDHHRHAGAPRLPPPGERRGPGGGRWRSTRAGASGAGSRTASSWRCGRCSRARSSCFASNTIRPGCPRARPTG